MTTLADVSQQLALLLEGMGCPYAIMGGLAVRAYANPRPTYDVDFAVAIPRSRLNEFFDGVEALGYTVPDVYRKGWVDQVGSMPLVKVRLYLGERGIDADVFLVENAHQKEALRRRRQDLVEGNQLWLVSPEDLIIFKLTANRTRDIADILDVIFMQGELDWKYIETWAEKLHVLDRWQRAREQVL